MPPPTHAAPAVRVTGVVLAAWCLAFAAVNLWQLATGGLTTGGFGAYATALVTAAVVVLVLKVLGAGVALASLRSLRGRTTRLLLGTALWGATSALVVYSVGNVLITVGTVAGLLAPSPAWEAAGGVTMRAVGYVVFFLAGGAMFATLAASFHRRHQLPWTAVAVGSLGAPVLLGGLLVGVPAVLAGAG